MVLLYFVLSFGATLFFSH